MTVPEPSLGADGPRPTARGAGGRKRAIATDFLPVFSQLFLATSFPIAPNIPLCLFVLQDSFQDWATQETDCPQNSE